MPGLNKQDMSRPAAAESAKCRTPDPISVIDEEHALQLEFCDILELIADSLPNRVDMELVRMAVPILRNSLPLHMKLEEEVLFPMMRSRLDGSAHLSAVLERLEDEHDTDEDFAAEIADAFEELSATGELQNAEMLGYMLRAFFESQRRHIAWENRVVLPLARDVLLPADLADFQAWIMTSGRPACTHKPLMDVLKSGTTAGFCRSCRNST